MTTKEFVRTLYPYAKECSEITGIDPIFILAQAALESGWGKYAPGNMYFGVKDRDGLNGNEQLITTTEYSQRSDLKFPEIIKVEPVLLKGLKYFKYTVKDYFRKYETPKQSFLDHSYFFLRNKRYAKALIDKDNGYRFADAVAKAGYATDPNYARGLKLVISTIERFI
jgi:flagellum-specific peptidoglycan hydrolase FlgJ